MPEEVLLVRSALGFSNDLFFKIGILYRLRENWLRQNYRTLCDHSRSYGGLTTPRFGSMHYDIVSRAMVKLARILPPWSSDNISDPLRFRLPFPPGASCI